MTEPINRAGGNTPSRQELADKLNEVIEGQEKLGEALYKIIEILGDSGIIEEAIEANKAIDKKEIN